MYKDLTLKNVKIMSEKEVSVINNNDENEDDYIYGSLTVEGGGAFKKGISIGMQEKMVSGLLIYDKENFYGFSEKYGLSLLSHTHEYIELTIPENIFEIKNIIKPVDKDFKTIETKKDDKKTLNIDLEIKDTSLFYIIIPEKYNETDFHCTFQISFIIDLNTMVSQISLIIINNASKDAYFQIMNKNCYVEETMDTTLSKNTLHKLSLEIISQNYLILTKKSFIQK